MFFFLFYSYNTRQGNRRLRTGKPEDAQPALVQVSCVRRGDGNHSFVLERRLRVAVRCRVPQVTARHTHTLTALLGNDSLHGKFVPAKMCLFVAKSLLA